VLNLEHSDDGKISRAIYVLSDKEEHAISAQTFVIAAHGIETPRLLLLSDSKQFPDGLANRSGLVGRFFMDHTAVYYKGKVNYPLFPFRKGFYTVSSEQFYDKSNRNEEAAFTIGGRAGGYTASVIARRLIERTGNWGEDFLLELEKELEEDFGRTFFISGMVEPLPDMDNRVELDTKLKDKFGLPCPSIHYDNTQYETDTYQQVLKYAHATLTAMQADADINQYRIGYGGHHAGTCRMGSDPQQSVVDRNLKAYDCKNMYVVGSSVFVTLSCANPTLTIAALALRLGDHLLSIRHAN
jgi:choline dehydrogenase-like flavoprotein